MFIKNGKKVLVVSSVHGDETFSVEATDHIVKHNPECSILVANTAAFAQNKRFIDEDLNRSFPGNKDSKLLEIRLAAMILSYIQQFEYVIDIHTTTSDLKVVPIIVSGNNETKRMAKLVPSKEVVIAGTIDSIGTLIGNAKNGMSLEFGEKFARENKNYCLSEIMSIIHMIGEDTLNNDQTYFETKGMIHNQENLENFVPLPGSNVYPFLVGEKSYNGSCFACVKLNT